MPTDTASHILLLASTLIISALYSSVGHGGASGYLAVMSFFSVQASLARQSALLLNLLVTSVAFISYARAGFFRSSFVAPFVAASVPAAFIGGALKLGTLQYNIILGLTLIWASVWLLLKTRAQDEVVKKPSLFISVLAGLVIGLVSGLVGVGGGIFLSPLCLLLGWAGIRVTAACSAFFIFVNSLAGLAGTLWTSGRVVELPMAGLIICAFCGGLVGSQLGSRSFTPTWLKRILSVVLLVAAAKLIFTAVR